MVTTFTPTVSSTTVKPVSFSATSLSHNPFKVLATQQQSVSTSVVALNTTVNKLYSDIKADISSDGVDKRQEDLGEEKWRDKQATADAKMIKLLKEISEGLKGGSSILPNLPFSRTPKLPGAPGRELPKVSPKGALGVAGKVLGVVGLGSAAYSAMNMSDNELTEYGGNAGISGRLLAFTRKFADTATFGLSEKLSSTINDSIEGTNISDNIGRSVATMFSLFDKGAADALKNDPVISGLKTSVSELAGSISKSSSAILGTTTAFLANAASTVGGGVKDLWNKFTGNDKAPAQGTPVSPNTTTSVSQTAPPKSPANTTTPQSGSFLSRAIDTASNVASSATSAVTGAISGLATSGKTIAQGGFSKNFNQNKQHIANAAKATGVDAGLLTTFAVMESGLKADAGATTSGAKGLFQFIPSTWAAMLKMHGSKYGLGPRTSVYDPRANSLMGAEYVKYNANVLKKQGLSVNPLHLYFTHFLGEGGGPKFLKQMMKTPNAIAANVFSKAAKANKNIFYTKTGQPRSFKQIYDYLHNNKYVANSFEDAMNEARSLAGQAVQKVGAVGSAVVAAVTPSKPSVSQTAPPKSPASSVTPSPASTSVPTGKLVTSGLLKSSTAINDNTLSQVKSGKLRMVANVGKINTTKAGFDGRKEYFSYSGTVTPRSQAINNLDPTVRNNLNNLAFEYKQATGTTLNVTTAARTYAQQKHFWDLYQAGKGNPANRPGYSLHEYGLAVDISPAQAKKAEEMGLLKKFGFYRPLPSHPREKQHIQPLSVAALPLAKTGDTQVAPPPTKEPATPSDTSTSTLGKVAKATGVTAVATAVTQKIDDVKTGVMEDASKPAEERSGNMVLAALKSLGIDGLEPAEGEEGSLLQHAAKVVTDLASLGIGVTKNVMSNMMDPTLNQREAIAPGVPSYLSPTKVSPVKTFDTVVKDVVNKYNPIKPKVVTVTPETPKVADSVTSNITSAVAPVVTSAVKSVDTPVVTTPQVKVEQTTSSPTPTPVAIQSSAINSEMELPSMKSPEVTSSDAKIPESKVSKGNESSTPTSNSGQNNSKVTADKDDLMIKSSEVLLFNLGVFA